MLDPLIEPITSARLIQEVYVTSLKLDKGLDEVKSRLFFS